MSSLRTAESGFTLTELMVVVVVLGVLAALATPSFRSLTQSQQVKNASFNLFASLSLARSEAIKRNGNVTLTPADTADWGQGWTITSASGETVRSQEALNGISISASGSPTSVIYTRSGRVVASTSFEIDVEGATTVNIRCIKIELSGMPRTFKGACT